MIPDQSLTQGLQFLTHWTLVVILPLLGIGALSYGARSDRQEHAPVCAAGSSAPASKVGSPSARAPLSRCPQPSTSRKPKPTSSI